MNVENILKVADAIERHTIAELGFNMGLWLSDYPKQFPDHSGHDCGTTACIGGWANAIQARTPAEAARLSEVEAKSFLGIDSETAGNLFYAHNYPKELQGNADHDWFISITAEQAVAVLRNLAATGEVDWSIASQPTGAPASPAALNTEGQGNG